MKAYDLDGVLIPDLNRSVYDDETFKMIWGNLKPTFVPNEEIVIVTMRRNSVISHTMNWLESNGIKVKDIYFVAGESFDFSPTTSAIRKADAINNCKHGITHFIESNPDQCELLRKLVTKPVEIVHFGSHIVGSIEGL